MDDFWLVFVHSVLLDAMTDLYKKKVCFVPFVQVEKLLGELGLGNVSKLRSGFGGYQANQMTHQVGNGSFVSTIQGDCLQKVQVQAMNFNGDAKSWDGRPSRRPNGDSGICQKEGLLGDGGKLQLIFFHACSSRFFKPAQLEIFRKPCPNVKFVKETSRLYTKGFGRCILCLDGWYDYCFSLQVLRSEHLVVNWITCVHQTEVEQFATILVFDGISDYLYMLCNSTKVFFQDITSAALSVVTICVNSSLLCR